MPRPRQILTQGPVRLRRAAAQARAGLPSSLVVIVTVLFVNNLAAAASRPLLPVYVESQVGLPPAFSGTLLALETALGGAVALAAGALTDRVGHRLVLVLGFLGFNAGLLQFTTTLPWLLVVLAIGLGLGHGLRSTAGQSYLLGAAHRSSVGVATAAYFLGGTLGSAMGAALAGPIIEAYGFGVYALVGLALNLVPIGLTLWKLPVLRTGRAGVRAAAQARDFWSVVGRREVLLLGGLRFFPTAFWGVWSLSVPLLIFRATDSVLATALYSMIGLVLATVSQFAVGRWSDRHGRTRPVYVYLGGLVLAAVLAALWYDSTVGIFAAGVLGTVAGWTLSVLVLGTLRDRTGEAERGRVVGFIHALWSFGFLTGSLSAGVLLDIHPAIPLALAAGFGLMALGMALALFRQPARSPAARPAA